MRIDYSLKHRPTSRLTMTAKELIEQLYKLLTEFDEKDFTGI